MAQIRQVVSEQLQATIRRLLPSQQGFTEDLQASNVITPIIDLTPSAEGDTLGPSLQQALSHGSVSVYDVYNTTTTIVNNTGYYRLFGACSQSSDGASNSEATISLSDGTTTKELIEFACYAFSSSTVNSQVTPYDFIVYLTAGDSCFITADAYAVVRGCSRQIADIDGNLVNP